jgi:flagellar hook-associated protein 1 FlgK
MRSSFFGLNIGTQGLYSARAGLDVTNHNIANSQTKGYSRQYAVQVACSPLSNGRRGMVGAGSEVIAIDRYRSEYLDNKYWSMHKDVGQYSAKSEIMKQVELIFKEPSDAGFSECFGQMFKTLETLSNDPTLKASRNNFINATSSYVEYINDSAEKLRQSQRDANFSIKTKVDQINYISKQIASLNGQITNLELSGSKANDLRDERIKLLDELSKVVNVEAKETKDANGLATMRVTINGQTLVNDQSANFLKTVPRETLKNPEDEPDLYDIYWTSGAKFDTTDSSLSGELKGLIDVRDGNNGENFKGTISSGAGTDTITINNPQRHDLPKSGEIYIDGKKFKYKSFTYEAENTSVSPATPSSIEFKLDSDCPPSANSVEIGDNMDFKGVPYYLQQLNKFVRTIALEFNKIHKKGDGDSGGVLFEYEGYTGTELDESDVSSYDAITVDNLRFSKAIENDPGLLKTYYKAGEGESSNALLQDLMELRHDTSMFAKGEPDDFVQSILGELAVDVKQSKNFKEGQEQLTMMIENQRLSFSGVDLNEETTNMLKYQQAYNVSAKIISVMDEIYDVTINRMGAN